MIARVTVTESALALITDFKAEHGNLLFHQSGGCCDNSAANSYLSTDLTIGQYDIHLGDIGGVPFYISASQYEYWKHTQLIIDAINGHGKTFSLEDATGKTFLTRSRLFTNEERNELQAQNVV